MVLRKGVSLVDALRICSFYIVYLLGNSLPFAFLLGVLLSMGRLVADNEIIAIEASGISILKILKIFLILGVIFSLFLFIINDRILPSSHYRYRSQRKLFLYRNIETLIEPRVFLEHFPNYILYVSDKSGNKLRNIFIYEVNRNEGQSKVTFAKRGEFITEGNVLKLKLEDGFRDESNPKDRKELYRLNFKVFFMDIPIERKKIEKVKKKPSDMKLKELKEKIEDLQRKGINPIELKAEFHKRISFSFSIITYLLLGFGVSLFVKHREKSINLGIAMLTGLFGYILFILGQTLIEYRLILPSIGMWLPNIIIGLIGSILIYKKCVF
jgi:lipopolysaccharide export system permease protein